MKTLIEVDIPAGRSVSEAIAAVKRAFDPDWMAEWWHSDDIIEQAEENCNEQLTQEEAQTVLRLMSKYHDCEVGICWGVIDSWIAHVVFQRDAHTGDCPAKDGFGCNCKENINA
jgi:hypothetical protein